MEGAGPVFSAGHDLNEMIGRDEAFYRELFAACTVMMETGSRAAAAGDRQGARRCDRGRLPAGGRVRPRGGRRGDAVRHPWREDRAVLLDADGARLPRGRPQAGDGAAAHRRADRADTALDWGLINPVVPADELDAAVAELVGAIARSSAATVATGKRAFYDQIDRPEREAYEHCQIVMADNALAEDAQEGITAFLEKRPPVWRDR